VSSEFLQVNKSVQCSMVDKTEILCDDGNVMVTAPSVNAITSITATDLSSKLPSKTMEASPTVNAITSSTATDLSSELPSKTMEASPTVDSITSGTATDLSSEPPSKTSSGVTNM